jgi:hypothetical protein
MSPEPVRLLDQADLPEAERSALDAGRAIPPVDYDVASGEARFRARLAALAAAGAAAGAAGAAAGPTLRAGAKGLLAKVGFKVFLGLAVGGAFTGGVLVGKQLSRPSVDPPSVPIQAPAVIHAPVPALVPAPVLAAPAATEPRQAQAPDPTPVQAPAPDSTSVASLHRETPHLAKSRTAMAPSKKTLSADNPQPEDPTTIDAPQSAPSLAPTTTAAAAGAPAEAHVAAPPTPAPPPQTAAPAQPAAPEPLSEIRAVALAGGLVDRDPEAALALLEKTGRAYPNGYFLEERQALTVLALDGAGHHSAARQAAQVFLRTYPNGPFSDRIRERAP